MEVSDEKESSSRETLLQQEGGLDSVIDELENENIEHSAVQVLKINLRDEYLKIQKKKVAGSQQRIEDGIVYFTVFSLMQIMKVRTFVQRLSDFAEDVVYNRPKNGWFELYTRNVRQTMATYDYMADLDSVYQSVEGNNVYSLFKNKGSCVKNTYVFFVMVELVDQTTEEFCWTFQLKTKPVLRNAKSLRDHGL